MIPFTDLQSEYQECKTEIDNAVKHCLETNSFITGPDADCAGNCYGQNEGDDFGNCCDMTSAVILYPDLDQTSTSNGVDCKTSFTGCSGEVGFCSDGGASQKGMGVEMRFPESSSIIDL